MFARWLFVRLNAAEKALQQGRIDDAYTAAMQPDLRRHPRGERLLDELVRPLVARARLHRQAGRFADGLADLDRLVTAGRAGPDVQALRQQVLEEMRQQAGQAAGRQQACDRVAEDLRAGRLETGRLDLQRIDDPRRRAELAGELEARIARGSQLLQQAAEALATTDVLAAARFWQQACERYGRTQATDEFAIRLAAACRQAVERWVDEGRLEHLEATRSALRSLLAIVPSLTDSERLVELCRRAVAQFSANDCLALRETLLRLKAARGSAAWVQAALSAVANITEGREALLASPLGLFASTAGGRTPNVPERSGGGTVAADPDAVRLLRPLLVLVDGGGSGLLVRRDLVRIGRGGGASEVDVPMSGDIQSHHADIVRRGEDYFLTAYGPVAVNGRRVEHTLLRDGDRVELGPGAKLVFCKPSAKSESAVLRLSHRSRLAQDVSDVVLFRDTCLIGPTAGCHLRTHEGHGQAVLYERAGGLYAHEAAGPHWPSARPQPVLTGRPLQVGDVGVTVKPYET
jgi:hypothetical protein